jgi:hypothetical protein
MAAERAAARPFHVERGRPLPGTPPSAQGRATVPLTGS